MHISRYGIPDKLMSDNGPQYDNQHFKKFIAEYELSIKRVPEDIPKATSMQKERFKQQIKFSVQQRKAMKILTLHCLVIAIHHVITF
jgi:transposase InsO family protein